MGAKNRPKISYHLILRAVGRFKAGYEVTQPSKIDIAAGGGHLAQQISNHREELVHRHDIQHLRVDRHEHRSRRGEGGER